MGVKCLVFYELVVRVSSFMSLLEKVENYDIPVLVTKISIEM